MEQEKVKLSLQFHFDDLMRIVYKESSDVREYFELRENYDQRVYEHFLSMSGFWSDDLYSWLSQSLIKYRKTGKVSKKLKKFILSEIERLKTEREAKDKYEKAIIKKEDNTKGYIYLIKSKNLYKIGRAKDIQGRIKTYKTENPFGIRVIFQKVVNDYIKTENKLLKRFKDKQIRGEWFELNKEDILWIKQNI